MSSSPVSRASYRPEAIWHARRAFFDDGHPAQGLIGDAVLRSWMRCRSHGRSIHEPVEFAPVNRQDLQALMERNQALLQVARPELSSLAGSVKEAGYAVLLTDAQGRALAVDGAIASRSAPLRQAFRAGVDLSEASIGTNAMCVAMSEQQPVRVFGPEHFFSDTQIFHCCAAPVFDAQGEVVGAVDVSHDMPGMLQSALWLAERCAQRIERRLFQSLPSFVQLEIDVGEGLATAPSSSTQAWLALNEDGQLMAASRAARHLIGLPPKVTDMDFGLLFEERFDAWVSRMRSSGERSVPLQLHSGVRLRAQPLHRNSTATPGGRPFTVAPHRRGAPACQAPERPCFGDERLEASFQRAVKAFRAELPVLLTGETGCGKDVAARALHQASVPGSGPFVALNCAAIPGELLAGELFGHVDGAFTGAKRGGALGKIEAAHGGTLFLDEIGDMPLAMQAALLRVLDSKEVVPLGATVPRAVDVRIVCATHRNLRERVAQGRFREDLYYRIAGHTFHLLPLRERRDFDAVLDTLLAQEGCNPGCLTADMRHQLRRAPWPGNVRQLAHALRRAIALAEPDAPLMLEDFALDVASEATPEPPHSADESTGWLQQVQDQTIAQALDRTGGNVTEAARLLGMGRATLYRRLGRMKRDLLQQATPFSKASHPDDRRWLE